MQGEMGTNINPENTTLFLQTFCGISKNRHNQENCTLKSCKNSCFIILEHLMVKHPNQYSFIGHLLNKYGHELNEKI